MPQEEKEPAGPEEKNIIVQGDIIDRHEDPDTINLIMKDDNNGQYYMVSSPDPDLFGEAEERVKIKGIRGDTITVNLDEKPIEVTIIKDPAIIWL